MKIVRERSLFAESYRGYSISVLAENPGVLWQSQGQYRYVVSRSSPPWNVIESDYATFSGIGSVVAAAKSIIDELTSVKEA